ncbi:MAG TPA: hypothetical protein PLR41_03095 [Alphaproteobacteria bacterium]|nr:hypothetical protein [Alphaproteobacteria bacterium]
MVTAPVRTDRIADLRALLASMNSAPGVVDPHNALVPFAAFEAIHVARLVVAEDNTLDDRAAFPGMKPDERVLLIFLADCDGPGEDLLAEMARRCGDGLRRIFAHCDGFDDRTELLGWLRAHLTPPAAIYVNWVGRTVRQVREEAALHAALFEALCTMRERNPRRLHADLRAEIVRQGLPLAPVAPRTPLQWIGLVLLWLGVIALGLLLLPLVIVAAPFFLIALRRHETTDPVLDRRSDAARTRAIAVSEDRDVTNPFSAIGSLKPGFLRLAITVVALWLVNLSGILVYNRGRLARVSTIHFARWVLLDGNRRVFFASNYDGSLESYMDDFINKVAFGLNLVFSNGIAYPPTDWLVLHGAQREHMFKNFLHRRQVPTDVWYKAYPGLTTADLARNARIRAGFERDDMSDAEIRRWLAEI